MSERSIFIAALEKDDATLRAAYLDQACAGDEVLRARIERLLKAHDAGRQFPRAAVPQTWMRPKILSLPRNRPAR